MSRFDRRRARAWTASLLIAFTPPRRPHPARSGIAGLALWMLLGLCAVPAAAQTVTATTGAINGRVSDSTHAVVPGVTVRLSGPSLITDQTMVTDAAGSFRFSAVPPGDYTLTFVLAGFTTLRRDRVRVGLGFTATVEVELQAGAISDTVSVHGAPAIDLASTGIAAHFDSGTLAALPGARDIFALLASTPGVAMAKLDVGGNSALTLHEYTAYGLRATTGVHRNEVEGMRVGGANGINDNYLSDFASFSEIAINAVGHSAAMPVPGTMAQYVSKSGGNAYHGAVYADVQRDDWQATNIDDAQIARGVTGGPGLNGRAVNRLRRFRDFTGDIGGYLAKDRAWWYAAYRDTTVEQRYAWLLDAAATLSAQVATGKFTYNLSPRQKIIGYVQRQSFRQSEYFLAGISQPVQTRDAMPSLAFPVAIWKGEYNASLGDAVYFEARAGSYLSDAVQSFNSTEPRIVDTGANSLRGGSFAAERRIDRPQVNGSMSILKTGWGGSHTFRIGAEYMNDRVDAPHLGWGHPCNCVSTLTNGVPTQAQVLLGTNVSSNVLVTAAGFLDDTWRLHRRLTVSLGARLDRYQPGLPAQTGPQGQTFAANDRVLTFNNWGPRVGLSIDLTGDGRTVVKVHYGKFWLYPGANFTAALNPNPSGWSRTYRWTDDANGNGRWDPGEEGALLSVSGGSGATMLDPRIVNTYVHQATAFLEREVAAGLTVRTGLVTNAKRQPYGTINVSRPLSAYSVPIAIIDPGPDGRLGSVDDGAALTAYDLSPEFHGVSPVNVTTNLPDSDSNYYTWEITATRRQTGRWSTLASFTKTWHREAALGMGNDFTPNALINAAGQDQFTTWQAKLLATASLPLGLRVVPVVRAQSGTPVARTFVRALAYGNATIKAEPIGARRLATAAVVDVRAEKAFRISRARATGFVDVYNVLNTNAEQTVTISSGAAWLRPTAITAPRIVRLGARFEW